MALTLEATLVIPITMALTISIFSASVRLYERIECDAGIESRSFMYALENHDLWSCKVNESSVSANGKDSWSKMISVNPVREKNIIMLAMDTASMIKETIPVLKEMEALILNNENK